MKTQKALELLEEKRVEIWTSPFDPVVFTNTSKTLLKMIFPNSFQEKYESLDGIDYYIYVPYATQDMNEREMNRGRQKADSYFQAFKKEVENHGLEKSSQTNDEVSFWGNLKTFWGIVVVVVGAAFAIGMYLGGAKFDKEKSDYYEQVKALKSDTIQYKNTIKSKNQILNQKDSIIIIKTDSINELKGNIQNAYLYIGNIEKNRK